VRVFQQQQMVGHQPQLAIRGNLLLEFQRAAVIHTSEFPQQTLTH
jgi:hypothetical protein